MSLFVNTSTLHNHYQDCSSIDVSEAIERDCLSVLHKLHDQVNGLQLVQVVVQPLARLFNPASLAALVANVSSSPVTNAINNNATSSSSSHNSGNQSGSNLQSGSGMVSHHNQDLDGLSTATTAGNSSSNVGSSSGHHSRSQSFASAFNSSSNNNNNTNNSFLSSSSTYMMSPDTAQALIARLDTDRDVNWLMEIIGYGLSMPFSLSGEQDSVKDCCTIYCEWLASALLPYNENNEDTKYQQMSKLVPVPIRKDPNRYARKMLSHLYNVFLPRQTIALPSSNNQKEHSDAILTAVSRQAVLCHRVLRTIESIAHSQINLMDNQTWDHLLALLLTVNDKLLSGPTEPDDIGTQLHDRILGVLFELMLLSSAKSIPTAGLWKTFNELSLNWRHRPALVDHWRRITLLLTKQIVISPPMALRSDSANHQSSEGNEAIAHILDHHQLHIQYSTSSKSSSSVIEAVIANMSYDNLSQTWYRFLNLIGNPVELSDPNVISKTDEFYHSACASDNVLDPRQHPCLNVLPQIFMNSMAGLRDFIEAFLGTYQQQQSLAANEGVYDPSSYSRSNRGSIVSLSNNQPYHSGSGLSANQSNQQQQPAQPQALTPTQSRRTGIKSIAIKGNKVIPSFTSSSSGSHTSNATFADQNQSSADHNKSGGSTNPPVVRPTQFSQPKTSVTSVASSTRTSQQQFKLFSERPKCNSILHVFGDWLFSAALIGSDLNQEVEDNVSGGNNDGSEGATSVESSSTTTEINGMLRSYSSTTTTDRKQFKSSNLSISRQQSISSSKQQHHIDSNSGSSERIMLDPPLSADSFEAGQAEAMAILCKIFSSKLSSEDISPSYLSRFYLCLQHCLTFGSGQDLKTGTNLYSNTIRRQLLASVLINSTTLLQKDLDGINLLIPSFIKAIEFVFECGEKEVPIQPPPRQHNRTSIRYGSSGSAGQTNTNNVTSYDLRRACIQTLLNLLAYPFHFQDLAIRNCLNDSSPTTTFKSLRPRLLKLLFIALQTETDPTNMQILFGGLSLAIHDLASNSATKVVSNKDTSGRSTGRYKVDSTSSSSSSGNNNNNTATDSANSSLDLSNKPQQQHQDDTTSQSSFVFDSSGGFLVKSLHVTCHLLINIWKHETQVSLAALELLTTIARVSCSSSLIDATNNDLNHLRPPPPSSSSSNAKSNNNNILEMRNEYKQTTKWICDYICNQCSRPPPAHSRDMHSTIVAAYQCLSVWFSNHSYLLKDMDCVTTVLEVIELGVSGQKSKTVSINPTTGATIQSSTSKFDKILKPSSMRVKEAAESLLNICMVRSRSQNQDIEMAVSAYDTVLDEQAIAEIYGGTQYKSNIRQIQDQEVRTYEAYKLFKYFSDEDSVVFGLFEGSSSSNHHGDTSTKDSVICLLRTPFGKHCWRMKFNYYTEKSREKIIANKTQGLIKRPFQQQHHQQQQCVTPTSESRIFPFPTSGHNKTLYFNNSARYFPETIENLAPTDLDKLVLTLDDYVINQQADSQLKSDLDKMSKVFSHQILAEQKVISEFSMRMKRVECEEPQPSNDLEAARIIVSHLGLKTALSLIVANSNGDKVAPAFVKELKSLDQQSVRTCDTVNIFYVRRNRTSAKEILESVRTRHNVCLNFFEWILELGHPTVVKNHCRWTGKLSNSWNSKPILSASSTTSQQLDSSSSNQLQESQQALLTRNQMLTSDHGGAIFDGDRMTLYWSDMCQELAFLIPHKIEKNHEHQHLNQATSSKVQTPSEYDFPTNLSTTGSHHATTTANSSGFADTFSSERGQQQRPKNIHQDSFSQLSGSQDHNSDGQSLCSVTSDTSSHSTRAPSQQSSPRDYTTTGSMKDHRDTVSLSRQSVTTQKRKSTISSTKVGCDTNIIICWLECSDDIADIPGDSLLSIAELGYFMEDPSHQSDRASDTASSIYKPRLRDYVKYFISPMKNGLYRVNLVTSFGRQWLALPLVDGMTVSKGILSSLIRESVLNLCRRRRLDADSYQPPHVRRRLKLQDICNNYKISSRYESTEFYNNLFKNKATTAT